MLCPPRAARSRDDLPSQPFRRAGGLILKNGSLGGGHVGPLLPGSRGLLPTADVCRGLQRRRRVSPDVGAAGPGPSGSDLFALGGSLTLKPRSLLQMKSVPIFAPAGTSLCTSWSLDLTLPRAQLPVPALVSVQESGSSPRGPTYHVWLVPEHPRPHSHPRAVRECPQ